MASRRRSEKDKTLQFESDRESVAWSIIVGPIAAVCEDIEEACDDADDLIVAWRARRRALENEAPDEEEDE
jgi:hypothetical protein